MAKTSIVPGKGWFAEVRIPRKSMTPVSNNTLTANFNRNRVIEGVKVHPLYTWSPHTLNFGDIANFGTLHIGQSVNENLVSDGDFEFTGIKGNRKSQWFYWSGPLPERDTKIFRTAGVSMRFGGKRNDLVHKMPKLKPNTLYRLSFFIRQENVRVQPGIKTPQWCGFYVRLDDGNGTARYYPRNRVYGDLPWTRWEHTYRTSGKPMKNPYIHFCLRKSTGSVWLDHVEFVEVKEDQKK